MGEGGVSGSVASGLVRLGVEWRAQPGEGATEPGFPWPAPGKMQGEAARRAGEASGEREEPPPKGLGGHDLLTEADARCPGGEVMGHHLDRQPGAVSSEAARGEMVQSDADGSGAASGSGVGSGVGSGAGSAMLKSALAEASSVLSAADRLTRTV